MAGVRALDVLALLGELVLLAALALEVQAFATAAAAARRAYEIAPEDPTARALKAALDSGQVGGAALDVFVEEPAKASPLFGTPNFICTPHLGASTNEAQVNVALQVAEQMADFLVTGGVTNALNMPSLSAEEAPKLTPYMALAESLGVSAKPFVAAVSEATRAASAAGLFGFCET